MRANTPMRSMTYADEVYALWHEHITYSAATDETSIASGTLSAVELEELTRKWVRLMREGRDMLHHETTIAADRAAAQDGFPSTKSLFSPGIRPLPEKTHELSSPVGLLPPNLPCDELLV